MKVVTSYQNVESVITIETTVMGRAALTSANLTARERQLMLLLDKEDRLSEIAVSTLIGKVNVNNLIERGFIRLDAQPLITEHSPVLDTTIQNNLGKNLTKKPTLKNAKLQSFLTAYKAEAENCSLDKCQTCGKADECLPEVIEAFEQSIGDTPAATVMLDLNSDEDFENIMIAQALISVA